MGDASVAQGFYGRWARLYDYLARYTPGIRRLRRRAAAALELEPGDTVVEMGTGTGANLPFLREQVGPTGTVVGVDYTRGMLDRAQRLVDRAGWANVHLVHGDATRPPVERADGVLASFVVGMLTDPGATADDWCDLARGGTLVLVDAARTERGGPVGSALNLAFDGVVVASTPPTLQVRYPEDPAATLGERVRAARATLRARSTATAHEEFLGGVVRLTGGRIEE